MSATRATKPHSTALGIAFDVVFGAIPAAACTLYALYVMSVTVSFGIDSSLMLGLVALSATGLLSSLALLYAIFARGKVKHNLIVRGLLLAGVIVAAVVIALLVGSSIRLLIGSGVAVDVFVLIALMIALCAMKYLRLLSTPEVHP